MEQSLIQHLEHFIFQHSENRSAWCSWEIGVAFLVSGDLVFTSPIVAIGKISAGIVIAVTTIGEVKIMAISEIRSMTTATINQIVSIIWDVLFLQVEREQECPHVGVTEIAATCIPRVVSITANSSTKLSADKDQGIAFIVALLVESCTFKVVLWGFEYLLYFFWIVQVGFQEIYLLFPQFLQQAFYHCAIVIIKLLNVQWKGTAQYRWIYCKGIFLNLYLLFAGICLINLFF